MARTETANEQPEPDITIAPIPSPRAEGQLKAASAANWDDSAKSEALPAEVGKETTTDQATAGLTLPLRAKLLVVFGGFAILFLVIFGLGGWNFWRLNEQTNLTTANQQRLEQIQQLRLAWNGEQNAISHALIPGLEAVSADFERSYYRVVFENNMFLLNKPGNDWKLILNDLETRHILLTAELNLMAEDIVNGKRDAALKRWQESSPRITDLTARLTELAEAQSRIVESNVRVLDALEDDTWLGFCIASGVGLLAFILLVALANKGVIAPMGRLNVKLGQLLYGQTARITDRLNSLEYEVEMQVQKMAAARHDMKLPLSNIRNAAEITLICHNELPPDALANLSEIIEITDTSAHQINSLLARRDSRLRPVATDLYTLVERVVGLVDLRDFKVHVRVELERAVLDPELIEHVLLNLLSNARKFSTGGIVIGTRLHERGKDSETEFWVWNDGPVIPADERDLIFRAGAQSALGKAAGGHGLGLWIVKSIVERHSGRIVVESHEKVGTTFRVFLPYLTQQEADNRF